MVQVYSFTQYNLIFHHAIWWRANPQCHFHSTFFFSTCSQNGKETFWLCNLKNSLFLHYMYYKPCKNKRNLRIHFPIRIQCMIFNKSPGELKRSSTFKSNSEWSLIFLVAWNSFKWCPCLPLIWATFLHCPSKNFSRCLGGY